MLLLGSAVNLAPKAVRSAIVPVAGGAIAGLEIVKEVNEMKVSSFALPPEPHPERAVAATAEKVKATNSFRTLAFMFSLFAFVIRLAYAAIRFAFRPFGLGRMAYLAAGVRIGHFQVANGETARVKVCALTMPCHRPRISE